MSVITFLDIKRTFILGNLQQHLSSHLHKEPQHSSFFLAHNQTVTIMLAAGEHDYYYFNYYGTTLLLTIGDTENRAARQFLNSVPEHMFDRLATAIGNTIWGANEYDVQNNLYMTYLSGQAATQRFIEIVSTETTFFSLMPFDRICLSFVTFLPFHDIRSR